MGSGRLTGRAGWGLEQFAGRSNSITACPITSDLFQYTHNQSITSVVSNGASVTAVTTGPAIDCYEQGFDVN